VAGVARMALGWLWWHAWAGVGRGDAAAVGVAGVAFGDMHLGSTWQARHSVTSTSTFVSMAGVVLGDFRLPAAQSSTKSHVNETQMKWLVL